MKAVDVNKVSGSSSLFKKIRDYQLRDSRTWVQVVEQLFEQILGGLWDRIDS